MGSGVENPNRHDVFATDYKEAYCGFMTGARLLTNRGLIPVDKLTKGDLLVGVDGLFHPILSVNSKLFESKNGVSLDVFHTVLIRSGSFGRYLPSNNLYLQTQHCILFRGMFVPVYSVINGISILPVKFNKVKYFYLTLHKRIGVWAEGLAVECGTITEHEQDRQNNADESYSVLADEWKDIQKTDFGPVVEKARKVAFAQIHMAGIEKTSDPSAHVLVGGVRIEPTILTTSDLCFELPLSSEIAEIRSHTFVPAFSLLDSSDFRTLGICVRRMQLNGKDISFSPKNLDSTDWHYPEFKGSAFLCCWTRGRVKLPPGTTSVKIELAGEGHYWKRTRKLCAT